MGLLNGIQMGMYGDRLQMFGMGSQFDTKSLVDLETQMMQARDQPLNNEKTNYSSEMSQWTQLKNFLQDIYNASEKLKDISTGNKDVVMSDSSVATITANSTSVNGSYTLDVQKIATYQKIMSDNQGSATTALGYSGTVQINGKDFTFQPTMTLTDVAKAINSGGYGINATLISGYLSLSSQETGASNTIQLTDTTGSVATASSSDLTTATTTVTGTPVSGTYNLTVNQLASNEVVTSNAVTDPTATLGYSGTMTVNGQTVNVLATDTLQDVMNKVNNSGANVTASIDVNNKLVLTGNQTGSSQGITITDSTSNPNTTDTLTQSIGLVDTSNNYLNIVSSAQDAQYSIDGTNYTSSTNVSNDIQGLQIDFNAVNTNPTTITVNAATPGILTSMGLLNSSGTIKNQIQTAQDAKYSIDGVAMTSATNNIQNAITGVNITLIKPTTSTATFTINQDEQAITDTVQAFVDSYNKAIMKMNALTAKGAWLQGQNIPTKALLDLGNALTLKGGTAGLLPFQIGIQIDGIAKDGTIKFDSSKLTEAMNTNLANVTSMLTDPNGFVAKIYNVVNTMVEAQGSIDDKTQSLQKSIDDINNQLQKNQEMYQTQQQTIIDKYSNFETLMGTLNSKNDYLTAMIQGMNGNSNNKNN